MFMTSVAYRAIAVDHILDIHKYLMEKNNMKCCLDSVTNVFFTAMIIIGCSVLSVNTLDCVSMNNQECKIRTKIKDINNNKPTFYHHSIKINKCSASCNSINGPYAKLCVPNIIKNINFKVFDLLSRTNEARHIEWHEICKCKSCDIREYLDYKNCNCRNKIVDKLVEEYTENTDGNEMLYNETLNSIPLNAKVSNSCTIYIVLCVIFLIISMSISSVFIYFHWYLKKDNACVKFSPSTQITIY